MEKQKHTLLVKYSNTAPVSNLIMLIKIKNLPYFWTGLNILAYRKVTFMQSNPLHIVYINKDRKQIHYKELVKS